jgi:hypothetical protein
MAMATLPVFKEVTPVGISKHRASPNDPEITRVILAVTEATYDDQSREYRIQQTVHGEQVLFETRSAIPDGLGLEPVTFAGQQPIKDVLHSAQEHHERLVFKASELLAEDYLLLYQL